LTALDALRSAREAGVRIRLNGDDLELRAPMRPPDAVLGALRNHKPEIAALLRAATRPQGCSDEEWPAAITDAVRLGYHIPIPRQELLS
jgi:hypothetical protein